MFSEPVRDADVTGTCSIHDTRNENGNPTVRWLLKRALCSRDSGFAL